MPAAEKEPVFETVMFGGFAKEDVLDYLEELGAEREKDRAELEKQLEEQTGKAAAQEQKIAQLNQSLQQYSRAYAQKKAEAERLKAALDEMTARMKFLDAKPRRQAADPREQVLSRDEVRERALTEYSSILSEARAQAREIIQKAKEEAGTLRRTLEEDYDRHLEKVGQLRCSIERVRLDLDAACEDAKHTLDDRGYKLDLPYAQADGLGELLRGLERPSWRAEEEPEEPEPLPELPPEVPDEPEPPDPPDGGERARAREPLKFGPAYTIARFDDLKKPADYRGRTPRL